MPPNEVIAFRSREFKGSRLRCLLATNRPKAEVARFLSCVAGSGIVTESDCWYPCGFKKPAEARLDQENGLLEEGDRNTIADWWLANRYGANTPNWDLASTCSINDNPGGLLLVEAKAHVGEFSLDDRCGSKNQANFQRICEAIDEAQKGWDKLMSGFKLRAESHYQLSNRFAFAWKLATMNIPVVLAYLGFLNAHEMVGTELLRNHDHWRSCVTERSKKVVPASAWDQTFDVGGTALIVRTCSARVGIEAAVVPDPSRP